MKNVLKGSLGRVLMVLIHRLNSIEGLNFGVHIRKHIDIFPDDISRR